MSVFLDTSAIVAVIDRTDANHAKADRFWRSVLAGEEPLVTSNYVIVETFALVQHRIGLEAVRDLTRDVLPVLTIRWLGEEQHVAATAAVLAAGRRRLSLVDCTSFEVMKDLGIRRCFAFDPHFREQGFECLP
jgi:predicted nucleic acid-binding protein